MGCKQSKAQEKVMDDVLKVVQDDITPIAQKVVLEVLLPVLVASIKSQVG